MKQVAIKALFSSCFMLVPPETSVDVPRATQNYIPEDRTVEKECKFGSFNGGDD
jgi:hypothetical protein